MVKYPSVCPCPVIRPPTQRVVGLLLSAMQTGDINQ